MKAELSYLIERIEKLEGKKVDSINFVDGSAILSLDLDNKTLSFLHEYADWYSLDLQQATTEVIGKSLDLLKESKEKQKDRKECWDCGRPLGKEDIYTICDRCDILPNNEDGWEE